MSEEEVEKQAKPKDRREEVEDLRNYTSWNWGTLLIKGTPAPGKKKKELSKKRQKRQEDSTCFSHQQLQIALYDSSIGFV